ncbi:MAG: tRNA uridine-5-carboxymethylaminomethyl(34) synthesis GTPase MnmE [Melioribacteraceae bacterium]|nr:tRNA uridine-5-carboxymethylaminomethyl(34) synthesis GTPase MnmE [Melioribacteraceae bacterium]MDD3558198.1 tRNA uridine-5-carboxymethylaminomethyl(34) synthesis GTPase MnmE [Melioribacteraceae bacterium]
MLQNEDTITAIATPPGEGAISIIRISGNDSFAVADKIFSGKVRIIDAATHTIHYGKIRKGEEIIDDVLVSVFRNPNSFTGEDSIEISTHGNQLICGKIIELLVDSGVRLAEPGEFTKRAFLNGKLDLAQAEAVADIISARGEASLRGARNQLDGILSSKVNFLREMLINTSSLVELELDFAEEDLEFMSLEQIDTNIVKVLDEIEKLLSTYSFGRVLKDGINVALVGKPNVGKSSLLNYMLKEARAIVSEIPGTTRDTIREDFTFDGIYFKIYDTAGIRLTEDSIEKEGVERSRNVIKNADVVVFLNDINEGLDEELHSTLLNLTDDHRIITVLNKIDIFSGEHLKKPVKYISALTGEGIEELLISIKEKAISSQSYSEKTAIVSNIRHYQSLKRAKESLLNARETVKTRLSGEFLSVDLRDAESALGEIIGIVTTDDILNNIFSKFCIGK